LFVCKRLIQEKDITHNNQFTYTVNHNTMVISASRFGSVRIISILKIAVVIIVVQQLYLLIERDLTFESQTICNTTVINSETSKSHVEVNRNDNLQQFDEISYCSNEFYRLTRNMTDLVPGLTEEDFERSIAHIGNRYRFAQFVNKLTRSSSTFKGQANSTDSINVDPVYVVVCGGSISLGHGTTSRYSDLLEDWFNTAYPLTTMDRNGNNNRHRVYNRGGHGADVSLFITKILIFFKLN
jgi:hypothetical protein